MRFIIYIVLFFSLSSGAQTVNDTLYFNDKWKETFKEDASFFRTFKALNNNYQVFDYYINGNLQMTCTSLNIDPIIKTGETIYYDKYGRVESKGFHYNNMGKGHWVWYFDEGKDSSVADYNDDGTKNYTHICSSCQIKDKEKKYTVVEVMPEFKGGKKGMVEFIQKNMVYPRDLASKNIGGKTFLRFVVTDKGKIDEVTVVKGSGVRRLDLEAINVIEKMPSWTPGTQNGVAVSVFYNIPINFNAGRPCFIFNPNIENEAYLSAKRLIEEGNIKDAYTEYEKLLSIDPKHVEALYNTAIIFYMQKENKKFCKTLKTIQEITNEKYNMFLVNSMNYLDEYCK